jgi:transcription elongation GreA/GreB family factor
MNLPPFPASRAMRDSIDKNAVLDELRRLLKTDLEMITVSQRESHAGATHEDAKSEGSKDMRSTEASYVAHGLAQRVVELRDAVAKLDLLSNATFDEDDVVALTALVFVEDEAGVALTYYIAPCGGGVAISTGGHEVSVVTPTSPLGHALLGRAVDDEVDLQLPRGRKLMTIVGLA